MNYKNVFKRETKVIAYVVIALTLVVIGTSYALFLQVNNNRDNQVVTAGSLVMEYSKYNTVNVDENDENNCLIPQEDSTGSGSGGCNYTLSITNKGTLPMQYDLLIYNNTADAPSDAEFVDHSLIRHSLNKQNSKEGSDSEVVTEAKALSELTLKDNKRILETSVIGVGETITFSLKIWISSNATADIIGQYVYLKLDVVGSVPDIVCKRSNVKKMGYSDLWGSDKYYILGNEDTTFGKLVSGDPFTCDVDGDGVYNDNTERFYYVTDIDSDKAVLIYDSDVSQGVPTTSYLQKYPYSDNDDYSPSAAIAQLPTTEQWKNVSLFSTTRDLIQKDNNNETKLSTINYAGKAARLLTYNELLAVNCASLELSEESNNCNFLLDSVTSSGYWLETRAPNVGTAWYVSESEVLQYTQVNEKLGVRPVIEVEKSKILY